MTKKHLINTMKRFWLFIVIILVMVATVFASLYVGRSMFRSEFLSSIKNNDVERLKKVLASNERFYTLNFYEKNGELYDTPLYWAISLEYPELRNNFNIARYLLEQGADPNLPIKSIDEFDFKKYLNKDYLLRLIIGRIPTRKNKLWQKEDIRMVAYLLEHDANPNLNSCNNNMACNSPLMTACSVGNVDVVKLLLQHHADVNFYCKHFFLRLLEPDEESDTLDKILTSRCIKDETDRVEIVKLLFDHGYDFQARCKRDPSRLNVIKKFIAENKKLNPQLATYLEEKIKELGSKNAKKP